MSDGWPALSDAAHVSLESATRVAVLVRCEREPRSVRDMAHELGTTRPLMHHHVSRLVDAGLLREVDSRPNRGKVERFFSAAPGWGDLVAAINSQATWPAE